MIDFIENMLKYELEIIKIIDESVNIKSYFFDKPRDFNFSPTILLTPVPQKSQILLRWQLARLRGRF